METLIVVKNDITNKLIMTQINLYNSNAVIKKDLWKSMA